MASHDREPKWCDCPFPDLISNQMIAVKNPQKERGRKQKRERARRGMFGSELQLLLVVLDGGIQGLCDCGADRAIETIMGRTPLWQKAAGPIPRSGLRLSDRPRCGAAAGSSHGSRRFCLCQPGRFRNQAQGDGEDGSGRLQDRLSSSTDPGVRMRAHPGSPPRSLLRPLWRGGSCFSGAAMRPRPPTKRSCIPQTLAGYEETCCGTGTVEVCGTREGSP